MPWATYECLPVVYECNNMWKVFWIEWNLIDAEYCKQYWEHLSLRFSFLNKNKPILYQKKMK